MDIRIRKVTELAVGKRAVYSCDMTPFRFSAFKQKPEQRPRPKRADGNISTNN